MDCQIGAAYLEGAVDCLQLLAHRKMAKALSAREVPSSVPHPHYVLDSRHLGVEALFAVLPLQPAAHEPLFARLAAAPSSGLPLRVQLPSSVSHPLAPAISEHAPLPRAVVGRLRKEVMDCGIIQAASNPAMSSDDSNSDMLAFTKKCSVVALGAASRSSSISLGNRSDQNREPFSLIWNGEMHLMSTSTSYDNRATVPSRLYTGLVTIPHPVSRIASPPWRVYSSDVLHFRICEDHHTALPPHPTLVDGRTTVAPLLSSQATSLPPQQCIATALLTLISPFSPSSSVNFTHLATSLALTL